MEAGKHGDAVSMVRESDTPAQVPVSIMIFTLSGEQEPTGLPDKCFMIATSAVIVTDFFNADQPRRTAKKSGVCFSQNEFRKLVVSRTGR